MAEQVAWYAARTRFGQETGIKNRLEQLGVDHFIPLRKRRNYRGKEKDHPVIPNLVFIHASQKDACSLKVEYGLPLHYVFDYVSHTMLQIPPKQMDDFIRVLSQGLEEGGLVDQPLELGDRVRVTRGPLKGVEGNVVELQGKLYVVVSLCDLLFARARIPRAWLEKVEKTL